MNITNEDNMDLMARYKDNHFDLAIVDPPYGIGNFSQSDARHKTVNWNDSIPKLEYFKELIRVSKKRIIWGANYYNCFELGNGAICWWKNVGHPNMSHCEIASVSGQKKVDYYHQNWSGGVRRLKTIHPCEKPIKLYEWLLMNYASEDDKILDTHLGSGSIAIACHNLKFDLTACELDSDYYNAAMKRIIQHKQQIRIF